MLATWNAGLRRLAPIALLAAMPLAACEESSEPGIPAPPDVRALSSYTLSPGDTVTITGGGFASSPVDNVVTFANAVATATPFTGGASSITVIVPRDAVSGPVLVSIPEQPQAGVGPDATVTAKGVGEVWLYEAGSVVPLTLDYTAGTERYLVVPHGSKSDFPNTQAIPYSLSGMTSPPPAPPAGASRRAVKPDPVEQFHARLWNTGTQFTAGAEHREALARPQSVAVALPTRNFNVLNTITGSTSSASSYSQITADLRYTGTHLLIYSDQDTLSSGNFTQANYNEMGDLFEQTIYANNHTYFGVESDIDSNGKVIMVFSPVINRLTPTGAPYLVGGFFNSVDLFLDSQAGIDPGTTNEGELVYMLVPDPAGQFSNALPLSFVLSEDKSTMPHEFQHLISFSYRLFQQGGAYQQRWLEEGMAHMAEDLNGLNNSNEARGTDFLAEPNNISIEDNSTTLIQRGAIYLFLRWLGDRINNGIYSDIVHSSKSGRASISAVTGENFYRTFADFLATLYLSGRGINTDPMWNYQSINLLADFGPLSTLSSSATATVAGTVLRSASEFRILTGSGGPVDLTFSGYPDARLRATVVRIQ